MTALKRRPLVSVTRRPGRLISRRRKLGPLEFNRKPNGKRGKLPTKKLAVTRR
jgi:hypothetical protein